MAELESAMEFLNRIHRDATDEDARIDEDTAAELVEARDNTVRLALIGELIDEEESMRRRLQDETDDANPTYFWAALVRARDKYSKSEGT